MRFRARWPFTAVCLSALVLLLALAPASAGARVVIDGGEARLILDRGLSRELRRDGVDVAGTGAATAKGRLITLPVLAGATNGAPGRGALTLGGGFSFDAGPRVARIGEILLNTGKGQSTAKIVGTHRILAKHGSLRTSPAGFGTRIRISDLSLTRGTAAALNRKLGLIGVFRPGRRLGSLIVVAIPESVMIEFGEIVLGGPDTAFSKLESLGVHIGSWGASERWSTGAETYFEFPIVPTTVAPDASAGILASEAGDGVTMEIHTPPPRDMLLREPRIDLAGQELAARVSAMSAADPGETATIATLDYSAAEFQIRPKAGAFELRGIRAVANQFIADQLNSRFATPGLFQAGETLAQVGVILHAPAAG